ncbi:MAG: TMEM14 family protein [Candidatus Caenarcaniphilales bacterium]|nr:TMEM14 family protein [Candidatus Caenarcaniphilales bacterium]
MNNKIFTTYGAFLILMGLIGFFLTHAKSALISGLASGAIMLALSFFIKNTVINYISKGLTLVFLGVFTWRFTLALMAFSGGNAEKLIPTIILGLMAFVSLFTLIISLLKASEETN